MEAYHFLKDNMRGGYGREKAWKIGEEREVKGELKMCEWGYHASPSFYDALPYAKGSIACIVELSGEIIKATDKYIGRKRKLIKAVNAEKVLRTWGCDCAERALRKAKVKDERSWNAIKVARLYNEDKATKKELAAAWAAAWAAWAATRAVSDATSAAAWAAARAAARAAWAARATAEAVARAAARAAWAAAWATAEAAAEAAAEVAAEAARAAAWAAAEAAETQWQRKRLNKRMKELMEQ